MKYNNQNAEELLLSNKSLDELISIKMQQEMENLEKSSKLKTESNIVTEISSVPRDLIFSKKACFRVINKRLKIESFINGIQAEGLLGLQDNVRKEMLEGKCDVFSTDDLFVKFYQAEIN